eukprot:scaffold3926_cov26-Cyclotella_meneghiniana.AAC.7
MPSCASIDEPPDIPCHRAVGLATGSAALLHIELLLIDIRYPLMSSFRDLIVDPQLSVVARQKPDYLKFSLINSVFTKVSSIALCQSRSKPIPTVSYLV